MSTNVQYHYITLNRVLDVASGEFELSIGGDTVYRLDTNDSTVNLQLNDRGNDKIPLISKRRIDVGSGGFDKIIISWTGLSVPQTLQLLIGDSQKRSDVVGVELSDFSTTVTGSTSTDLVKIGGNSNIVTNGYFNKTKSLGSTAGSVNLSGSTTGTATLFTVPANFVFLITSVQIACDTSSNSVLARLQLEDTSGNASILSAIVQHSSLLGSVNASFPLPVVANATDTLVMVDGGGSATPTFMVAGNLVGV